MEAQSGAKGRFDVSFRYGTSQTQVMVRRPYDPYFNGGYGYGGFYGPRPWGGYYGYWGPDWVDVPMVVQRNTLTLQIHDSQRGGAEVYRSSAFILSEREDVYKRQGLGRAGLRPGVIARGEGQDGCGAGGQLRKRHMRHSPVWAGYGT